MRSEPMNFQAVSRPGPQRSGTGEDRKNADGGGPGGGGPVMSWRVAPIGVVRTPFVTYCDPPRHFRRVGRGTVEVFPEFEDGLKDVDGFSHLWLITLLHRSGDHDLLVRPRGSESLRGLFATRSPRRPNPIGLSLVKLVKRDGRYLQVTGIDLLDGTPLLDIKPYLPDADLAEAPSLGWFEVKTECPVEVGPGPGE